MLQELRVLFLDFQTTGAKPESGEVLEIAWSTEKGEVTDHLIKPEKTKVSPFIQKMTGINQKLLENASSLEAAVDHLRKFVSDYKPEAVVIHYAKFEQPFLEDIANKFEFKFDCPVLCTHEIAKRIYPNLPARGVAGLAGYFGSVMKETKRGRDHVQATKVIWSGLVSQLNDLNISDLNSVTTWLLNSKPAKKTKYEYPLAKEKRLNLPEKPGLYRMLGKNGEVLYVGKATSLRDRVNSYFRGQKKRNSFKLQMLAQVWDIEVTVCDSALEAALLESDEIKKWNPRYNVALKANERELTFYNRDFSSAVPFENAAFVIGPFSGKHALSPLLRLHAALFENLNDPQLPEDLLFEAIDTAVLKEGFRLFRENYSIRDKDLKSIRSMLCLGMKWHREYLKTQEAEEEEQIETVEESSEEIEESEYTAEDVSEKFLWVFHHSAAALYRAKKLKALLNCEFDINHDNGVLQKTLKVRNGKVTNGETCQQEISWDIATYDRLSVLYAESNRLGIQIRKGE